MPINVTKPPTDDPLVRQAILYAVDQKTLVSEVLFGVDTPAHTVLTPITPGYSAPSGALYSYDPAKAQALLDQAGWKVGPGGIRVKNGKKLALEIILYSNGGMELPTQFVVSELNKVGFSASTIVQPFATAQASFNAGVHNLGAFGYYGTDPYLLNIWVNSDAIKSGFNWSHYDNPKIDALIAQANGPRPTRQGTRCTSRSARPDEGRHLPAAVERERPVHHGPGGQRAAHHAQRLRHVPLGGPLT